MTRKSLFIIIAIVVLLLLTAAGWWFKKAETPSRPVGDTIAQPDAELQEFEQEDAEDRAFFLDIENELQSL